MDGAEVVTVLPWQGDVLEDDQSPIIAAPCGLGAGKTRLLVDWALHRGWLNSPIPTMLVEPTYGMVTDILLPMFEEVCDQRKILYRWVGPQGGGRKSSTVTIKPGHGVPDFDIMLRSADEPKRLDGKNIGAAGIDEAGQCKSGTIGRVRRRVRHPLARVRQLLITGTPEDLGDYYEWCEAKPQPGTRLVRANTAENIWLPEDYVSTTLSHLDEDDRQQYMRGHFIARGSRAYRSFNRAIHGMPCTRIGDSRIEVGADFNFGKMSWIEAVSRGDEGHVFGELVRYDTTTWDQGEALTRHLQERLAGETRDGFLPTIEEVRRRTTIYCDPSAKNASVRASESDVQQLRRMGFDVRVSHTTIPVKDRVMTTNWRFRDPPRLFVDVGACPKLTEALERQGRDEHGDPVKDRDPKKDLSAETDALGYWLWTGHPEWRATVPAGNSLHLSGYV